LSLIVRQRWLLSTGWLFAGLHARLTSGVGPSNQTVHDARTQRAAAAAAAAATALIKLDFIQRNARNATNASDATNVIVLPR